MSLVYNIVIPAHTHNPQFILCMHSTLRTATNIYRRPNKLGTLQRLLTHTLTQRDNVSLINFFIVVPTDVFVGPEVANVT
jgi:hypothetical protein